MTISIKPTATQTVIEQNGSTIATLDSDGLTMASGMTIVGDGVGKIVQVLQATKTDTFSTNSQTFVDIPDMTVTITPSSASSKVLVFYGLQAGISSGHAAIKAVRTIGGTTTDVLVGDAEGLRTRANQKIYETSWRGQAAVVQLLDSPNTTSAVTYKVQCGVPHSATYVIYINRSGLTANFAYDVRSSSTITVMEVAA